MASGRPVPCCGQGLIWGGRLSHLCHIFHFSRGGAVKRLAGLWSGHNWTAEYFMGLGILFSHQSGAVGLSCLCWTLRGREGEGEKVPFGSPVRCLVHIRDRRVAVCVCREAVCVCRPRCSHCSWSQSVAKRAPLSLSIESNPPLAG